MRREASLVFWVGWMGSKSFLALEGEENIYLSAGNETLVMRNSLCFHQQVKPNLRLTKTTLVKSVSGIFLELAPLT